MAQARPRLKSCSFDLIVASKLLLTPIPVSVGLTSLQAVNVGSLSCSLCYRPAIVTLVQYTRYPSAVHQYAVIVNCAGRTNVLHLPPHCTLYTPSHALYSPRTRLMPPLRTSFAAESGQIRKNRTFSNLRGLNLCTSHILVFGCLHGQDVIGS